MEATSVWFSEPRRAEVRAEDVRAPGDGELLIQGIVSLISAGTEMLVYRGELVDPAELMLDRPGRGGTFPFPVKYGYQVVGRVVEAGAGATLPVGQVVFAVHPHQSLFVLPSPGSGITAGRPTWVYPVPDGLDPETAAYTNLFGVALNALLDAPVRVGDCVVVSGLGIIGLFLARLARLTAHRLILIEPREHRRAAAADIGADAVVTPDDAVPAVQDLTGGRGADLFFEASGVPQALQTGLAATGQDGSIVVVSYYGSRLAQLVLAPEFHYRRISVISTQAGRLNPALTTRWDMVRRVDVAMTKLAQFGVHYTTHRFPLREAARAYEVVDRGEENAQGVLLTY